MPSAGGVHLIMRPWASAAWFLGRRADSQGLMDHHDAATGSFSLVNERLSGGRSSWAERGAADGRSSARPGHAARAGAGSESRPRPTSLRPALPFSPARLRDVRDHFVGHTNGAVRADGEGRLRSRPAPVRRGSWGHIIVSPTIPAAAARRTCTGSSRTPSGGCAWRAGSPNTAPWRTSCRAGPARSRRPRCRAAPRRAAAWSRHRR
jgi:hypothetical protein